MSDYVNKIKKGETEYDVQDARLNPTAEDSGKALVVDENGGLKFDEVGGGGGSALPIIDLTSGFDGWNGAKKSDLFNALTESGDKYSKAILLILSAHFARQMFIVYPSVTSGSWSLSQLYFAYVGVGENSVLIGKTTASEEDEYLINIFNSKFSAE